MMTTPNAIWRNCYKCGFEGNTSTSQCPNCGQRLRTANEIRWLGVVLVLCGVFLAGIGGALFIFLGFIFTQAGQPGSGVKMSEQAGDGSIFIIVFGIFTLLIALGLTAITAGAWQIFFGRRNKFLVYMFLGLVVATLAVGGIARILIE